MIAIIGSVRLGTSIRQSRMNAAAGSARNVIELMDVPSIERPTAQPGNARLPRKYSSVLLLRLEKYAPIAAIAAR